MKTPFLVQTVFGTLIGGLGLQAASPDKARSMLGLKGQHEVGF